MSKRAESYIYLFIYYLYGIIVPPPSTWEGSGPKSERETADAGKNVLLQLPRGNGW